MSTPPSKSTPVENSPTTTDSSLKVKGRNLFDALLNATKDPAPTSKDIPAGDDDKTGIDSDSSGDADDNYSVQCNVGPEKAKLSPVKKMFNKVKSFLHPASGSKETQWDVPTMACTNPRDVVTSSSDEDEDKLDQPSSNMEKNTIDDDDDYATAASAAESGREDNEKKGDEGEEATVSKRKHRKTPGKVYGYEANAKQRLEKFKERSATMKEKVSLLCEFPSFSISELFLHNSI